MQLKDRIFTIRNQQVMLDRDLAELYEVQTKNLNKAVKRNIERFPEDFCFQLNGTELNSLRFQIGTLDNSRGRHTKYLPYVFTQEGIAALSGILRSQIAIDVNIKIMRAFVSMRKTLMQNAPIFQKFQQIDQKLIEHDSNFTKLFTALDQKQLKKEEGIFFEGQLFDAYKFISDLISQARESIILIDNYVNEDTLVLFSESNVPVKIYTRDISKKMELVVNKFNQQYGEIEVKEFSKSHDRFLIIDEKEVYFIGASLKDLGKKWFAFTKMKDTKELLQKIK